MDVHKDSIDVAVADAKEARLFGRIGGEAAALDRAIRKLRSAHRDAVFVYEAGPCGFWIYRRLRAQGVSCMVVSPSMTPRRAGDRVKTDRRDALQLARLARAGELAPIYVPDSRDEAVRDLVRARGRGEHAAPGEATLAGAAGAARHLGDPRREDRGRAGRSGPVRFTAQAHGLPWHDPERGLLGAQAPPGLDHQGGQ